MLGLGNTLSGGIVPAAADNPITYFTTGSLPSGWILPHGTDLEGISGMTGVTTEISWADPNDASSGNYFWIRGDANNTKTGYPLRHATAFQGDYLFQLSFYAGDVTCRDWGIVLSPDDAASTATDEWLWVWSTNATRIAIQANCTNPTIYGFVGALVSGATIDSAASWYTYHMYSRPSAGTTTMIVTIGQDDWELEGTQQGETQALGETVVGDVSTDYWFGIGGDSDWTNDAAAWAKANAVRITAL